MEDAYLLGAIAGTALLVRFVENRNAKPLDQKTQDYVEQDYIASGVNRDQWKHMQELQTDKTANIQSDFYGGPSKALKGQSGLRQMRNEMSELLSGAQNRLFTKLRKFEGTVVMDSKKRPVTNSITRELTHPLNGRRTNLFQEAFLPSDPTEAAIRTAAFVRQVNPNARPNEGSMWFRNQRVPGRNKPLSWRSAPSK